MLIEVTQEDIKNGEPKNCLGCPIALAIHRAFPKTYRVIVSPNRIGILQDKKMSQKEIVFYETPATVKGFIELYDNSFPVFPFTFELDEPLDTN